MADDTALLNPLGNRKKSLRYIIGVTFLLALFLFGPAVLPRANAATMIYVTTTADEYGTGTGCSLREAVQAANTNLPFGGCVAGSGLFDTINLPAGTYTLAIDGLDSGDGVENHIGDLDITEAVNISGAGSGFTFIKGGADFDDRVLYITSASGTNITGVRIRDGKSPTTGGGLNAQGSLVTLVDVVFYNNTAAAGGGALDIGPGSTVILNSVRLDNNTCTEATCDGGGIRNDSVLQLIDSVVENNHAQDRGGGIYSGVNTMIPTQTTIVNSVIRGNSADAGGGIYSRQTMQMANSLVENNAADQSSNSLGGGIYLYGDGSTSLVNVTISGNRSNASGGGIFASSTPDVTLKNVTITENIADDDLELDAVGGGGLYVSDATITIANSILAKNVQAGSYTVEFADCYQAGSTSILSSYSIQGVHNEVFHCCNFNGPGDMQGYTGVPVYPGLAPLQDNGGLTETHALHLGSPAIDAGDPTGCTNPNGTPLTMDQRGDPRPEGEACDMGAFEHQQPYGLFLPLIVR
jgi:CSLREA domain-containing protein